MTCFLFLFSVIDTREAFFAAYDDQLEWFFTLYNYPLTCVLSSIMYICISLSLTQSLSVCGCSTMSQGGGVCRQ